MPTHHLARLWSLAFAVALGACGSNSNTSPYDFSPGPDLAPRPSTDLFMPYTGMLGSPCDLNGQISGAAPRGGCDVGLQCKVARNGGPAWPICIPLPKIAIAEGNACGAADLEGITSDNCGPNLYCAKPPGQTTGTCQKYCFVRSDCGPGQACSGSTGSLYSKVIDYERYVRACLPGDGCDPVAQTGCPMTTPTATMPAVQERCIFSASDNVGRVTVCVVATGTGLNGADCASSLDCGPGYACAGLGACRQMCNRVPLDGGLSVDCPTGLVCQGVYGYPEFLGLCQ